jgi:hypothetical protein
VSLECSQLAGVRDSTPRSARADLVVWFLFLPLIKKLINHLPGKATVYGKAQP